MSIPDTPPPSSPRSREIHPAVLLRSPQRPVLGKTPQTLTGRLLRRCGAVVSGTVVITTASLLLHQLFTGESWRVQSVELVGNQHASDAALRHLSDVRTGAHLASVNLDRAVAGVERHPWVKRAEAKRRFPGTVEMAIEEHEPVLLLSLEQLWYVNADGTPFKRARTDSLDFPLLTGLDSSLAHTRPDIAQRIVLQSLHIVETVEHQTELGPERVSEVHFSQRAGFEVVLRNGTRLVLGWQDPDQQLSRFARLMEVGLDPSIPQRVDLDAGSVAIATPLSNPT